MDTTDDNMHHDTRSNNFRMHDNALLLSDSLVPPDYSVPTLKDNCHILRTVNHGEYLQKNEFMPEITSDMGLNVDFDHENQYRSSRQLHASTSSYEMKSLNHDIPHMSFADDLRSLNRETNVVSSFNYYPKNISPGPDIYSHEFPTDFTNSNYSGSLPSTSGMFPPNDNQSCYVISETQADEMILNGIELNEPEKLIGLLSTEELDNARHGSCFEVILNNGEILYAVIDSENEFGSSARLVQIAKEMLVSERQCTLPVALNPDMSEHLSEPQYENNVTSPHSNFPSKSPVENFDVASRDYHSNVVAPLPKSINSTPIPGDNFHLCCDYQTSNSRNQFPSDMNSVSYSTIVSSKANVSFDESTLSKSDISYTCASHGSPTKQASILPAESKNNESTTVPQPEHKIDYFPSAVNSIVVSETGKKYPKKYSFYSNNFSSFEKSGRKSDLNSFKLDQLACTPTVAATTVENLKVMNERLCTNDDTVIERVNSKSLEYDSSTSKTEMHTAVQLTDTIESHSAQKMPYVPVNGSQTFCHIDLVNDENDCTDNHDFAPSDLSEEQILKNKFMSSRMTGVVNSICDQAVQSRARATLPSTYLSINRIRGVSSNNKSTYGIFARQTIPGRTQFGPMEGVLVKTENEEKTRETRDDELQLTVAVDDKFWRLDVSNEDVSNWMRFVRPAISYKEQNLILTQQGSALYFTTIEVIHPKQELLVWYSAEYSRVRSYKLLPGDPNDNITHNLIDPINQLSTVLDSDGSVVRKSFSNNERNEILSDNEIAVNDGKGDYGCDRNTQDEMVSRSDSRLTNKSTSDSQCLKKRTVKRTDRANKSSLWLCEFCDMTFSNGAVMNLHMLAHPRDEGPIEIAADSHVTKDGDVMLYQQECTCPQCSQTFSTQRELISHVAKHGLKVQRWNDNKATESVLNKESGSERDNFEDTPLAKKFQCKFCEKQLKNSVALNIHERIHSENTFLECPICDTTFEKLAAMKEHVHTHAKNGIFSCPHCPKTYDRYKVIRKHIRSVHVTAKYVCKQCKKCFRSQYKLRSHMLKHSDNREFLCANCGKQFKRIDKLTEHIRNIHSEEREKQNMEQMGSASGNKLHKKVSKKKMPNKVLRLISENVNDYFYKCYVCNIGFKRRGMLVNHINMFHPNVSLDTIPELNVPILKAYCNFFCPYCDRVYKSNSKRKAHIIKSHPGAKVPSNSERGAVMNDPYAKHVKDVILDPFSCDYCYRQYASRAKLLSHHRRDHADLLPSDMKLPRIWQKKKRKLETTKTGDSDEISDENRQHNSLSSTESVVQLQNAPLEMVSCSSTNFNTIAQQTMLQNNAKVNTNDTNQAANLQQLLTDELRNSISSDQYLKILQSFNGIAIAQTDENSSAIIQQILTSYSFSSS